MGSNVLHFCFIILSLGLFIFPFAKLASIYDIDNPTHVVYSIPKICDSAPANMVENIYLNIVIQNNSLYLQVEIIFHI